MYEILLVVYLLVAMAVIGLMMALNSFISPPTGSLPKSGCPVTDFLALFLRR